MNINRKSVYSVVNKHLILLTRIRNTSYKKVNATHKEGRLIILQLKFIEWLNGYLM